MSNVITAETIATIQSHGFDVYMRNPGDSWCYFTDGKNIGYLQYDELRGFSLSTVHIPNSRTGTGFDAGKNIATLSKSALERAFAFAPSWASDIASVRKYADMAQFLNSSDWNRGHVLCA